MRRCGRGAVRVEQIDTISAAPAATTIRRRAIVRNAVGPVLFALSIAARLAWTYLAPNGANFVDLHVYIGGAATIGHPGTLYSYVYADQTPDFPLPFTYPAFAAVIFYPLHLLPFGLVAFCWQVGTMAALYGVVRISQRLLGVPAGAGHRVAMLWTAVAIWLEPLRSTFDYGQINVVLVLAALWAVYSTRWWLSGLLIGAAAGVKLTPAIAGLYFVGARRWGTTVFSAVVFLSSVALSVLVVGDQARYYFTDLIFDTDRVGPICTTFNQSWRGGICRIFGHDAGYGPLVLTGIAVTAVLAILAWRALSIGDAAGPNGTDRPSGTDRLGALLVVELFGLLLSPISWTHHWVWLVPLMIWLIHGPLSKRRGARILGWGWLVLTIIGVPWLLSFAQPTIWQSGRAWYLAWGGLVYIVATLVTLAWIAASGGRTRPRSSGSAGAGRPPATSGRFPVASSPG
ncbi:MAG: mannosyltransferase [Mycobacterium sp.]|nr:mannosyltransferase [Mycobacterium sp.]